MRTKNILYSTQPILYETGCEDWPYALLGSCFPVRWENKLYIISAFHCYENHKLKPENTLYPFPGDECKFVGFTNILRAKSNEDNDQKHCDQVILEVSIYDVDKLKDLNTLDLSYSDSILDINSSEVKDVWLRGYLWGNSNHYIDYEAKKIQKQAFLTNGLVSKNKSPYDYCFYLKVKTPTPHDMSPNGMSGSPVYVEDQIGNLRLAGTIIGYNEIRKEYLAIDAKILRTILCKENR